jgi:hypothetical protein
MRAAKEPATDLHPMANNFAAAMLTNRGNCLNGTLKAVEGMPRSGGNQFERLVVIISTNFALRPFVTSIDNVSSPTGAVMPRRVLMPPASPRLSMPEIHPEGAHTSL